jgi:hypothetical protein
VTFSLALANGDLVQQGSNLGVVYGTSKLTQDMTCWLEERLGVDRFHPRYGSVLPNFIGTMINASTQAAIQSEIDRVLGNYQAVQNKDFQANPQLYSLDQLLNTLANVNIGISYDTVSADISVTTGANTLATVSTSSSV